MELRKAKRKIRVAFSAFAPCPFSCPKPWHEIVKHLFTPLPCLVEYAEDLKLWRIDPKKCGDTLLVTYENTCGAFTRLDVRQTIRIVAPTYALALTGGKMQICIVGRPPSIRVLEPRFFRYSCRKCLHSEVVKVETLSLQGMSCYLCGAIFDDLYISVAEPQDEDQAR